MRNIPRRPEAQYYDKPHHIRDKQSMYEMLKRGEFGNTLPYWSVAEFQDYLREHPFPESVVIRTRGGGRAFITDIKNRKEFNQKLEELSQQGYHHEELTVNEYVGPEKNSFFW